jgi:hypothetical protein
MERFRGSFGNMRKKKQAFETLQEPAVTISR